MEQSAEVNSRPGNIHLTNFSLPNLSHFSLFGDRVKRLEPYVPPVVPLQRLSEEQQLIDIYKRCGNSVVFITTKVELPENPLALLFNFGGAVHQTVQGIGSGIVIDPKQGIVITNLHVVEGASSVQIKLADESLVQADLLGTDEDRDLAVLQIKGGLNDAPSMPIGNSESVEVGQFVLAIGNPLGLSKSMTRGIISAPPRTIAHPNGSRLIKGMIQTDASINPGNSGGALLDSSGNLIGMNTMIMSRTGGSDGLGFAVPINAIMDSVNELLTTGKIAKPTLGLAVVNSPVGPVIENVERGGPADRAGMEFELRDLPARGFQLPQVDPKSVVVIEKLNGKPVSSKEEFFAFLSEHKREEMITVSVRIGGPKGEAKDFPVRIKMS